MSVLLSKFFEPIKNSAYLARAVRHSSLGTENYERLEFLGDRVVGLVIADLIFKMFPNDSEGDMAKRHTALVQGETLAMIAHRVGLDAYVQLSEAEAAAGGRENDNILADVMESVIAAIYLEQGLEKAQDFIQEAFGEDLETRKEPPQDAKTCLQEWSQARGLGLPEYNVVGQDGPDHAPIFTVEVAIKGYGSAQAVGANKRVAQKLAAQNLLEVIKQKGCDE
jgi:ribonuclease-3